MSTERALHERVDWMAFPETAYATARSDDEWLAAIRATFESVLARAAHVGMQVIEHGPGFANPTFSLVGAPIHGKDRAGPGHTAVVTAAEDWMTKSGPAVRAAFYPPWTVGSHLELEPHLPPEIADPIRAWRTSLNVADCLGVLTYPLPNTILLVFALHEKPVNLSRHERKLLTQAALHVESGYRLRRRPELVKAELTADGRLIARTTDAPPTALLEASAARVAEGRSLGRRTSPDALDLWTALVAGRMTLAPRGVGSQRRYAVLENPVTSQPLRALSPQEREVLALAARGLSTKLIAYALGIGVVAISSRLASAATKIGVASRIELIRIAAMLGRDPRADLDEAALTDAEKDILHLLQTGLSNGQIAAQRSRAVRTVANQVASLLHKTGSASRAELVTRSLRATTSTGRRPLD